MTMQNDGYFFCYAVILILSRFNSQKIIENFFPDVIRFSIAHNGRATVPHHLCVFKLTICEMCSITMIVWNAEKKLNRSLSPVLCFLFVCMLFFFFFLLNGTRNAAIRIHSTNDYHDW